MAFARFDIENEAFVRFCEENAGWLSDYALYTALKKHFGDEEWQKWDEPLRSRDPEALKEYETTLHADILFYEFLADLSFYRNFSYWKRMGRQKELQVLRRMHFQRMDKSGEVQYTTGAGWKKMDLPGGRRAC